MAFAALVGDDRLVPVFSRQIKEWADNMRGKLAEYAVQALALLGTDAALLTVDAIAIRYRSKNKKIAKLPDSVASDVKTEFKELAASLKEAVKSQLLRMETLMVRQFRWPVARWQELYLQHPLLLPFTQRLVWGAYDKAGKLICAFRALEDHSLTDAADNSYTLPGDCAVGIVHPLELTPETRRAWLKHLADYDVAPPFAQLERPVVALKPDQRGKKFGIEVANTNLNAMTFKGRAERLGWTRGSVCDGGCITCYFKSFPTAGVDVFVETDGMYVGIDMYSDIQLGKVFFVKHASVQIGSYIYDEPDDVSDPRLVSYDDVHAIAFSEAMSDLAKIAGRSETPRPEVTDA
jgi:hypothetical protein